MFSPVPGQLGLDQILTPGVFEEVTVHLVGGAGGGGGVILRNRPSWPGRPWDLWWSAGRRVLPETAVFGWAPP